MSFKTPLATVAVALAATGLSQMNSFRPPAVPLVTHDPYFSIWSVNDTLNGGATRHWTGREHPLSSVISIDGTVYSLMGAPLDGAPAMPQVGLKVYPTRTVYSFASEAIEVEMTFCSPLLPSDLEVLTRPATYITWDVRARDGRSHEVAVGFSANGALTVNNADEAVTTGPNWIGSVQQDVLGKRGDDLRIDWGRLYLSAPEGKVTVQAEPQNGVREAKNTSLTAALNFHRVGDVPSRRHVTLAYDDEVSIQFFGQNLRPWWKRHGESADAMLARAEADYLAITERCAQFDRDLMFDLAKAGGGQYAQLGALAFRQALAAQKVVADKNGQPLMFSKENFSNGCIGTVDVLYPAAPQLLLFSPTLMKASLVPILEYAASPRWKFPFAPHDLGTYPLANGQVYGGGERSEANQMPVEESGNMLILLGALAHIEGNAEFSRKYWPQLRAWADYLADKGFDPENQLCTDDFAGHMAHNVNLSAKAIVALKAVAELAQQLGEAEDAAKYQRMAAEFASRWSTEAVEGGHTRLAFDKPGTWSQKYNLVWDKVLGYGLFSPSLIDAEVKSYLTRLNAFGLPLDSRRDYTKLDWIVWSATMAPTQAEFEALVDPTLTFLNATPDRVPMSDWFHTETAKQAGFQARSVVGGVFIKLLDDAETWRKWSSQDRHRVGTWAPIPKPPVVTAIVPTSEEVGLPWSYTTSTPSGDWFAADYPTSGWATGLGGFGTEGTPGAVVRTKWDSPDIWIRRSFELGDAPLDDLQLYIHHDEDAEVYVNGILVARLGGFTAQYVPKPLLAKVLKKGTNIIAIHCHQTTGGQYIDAGFVTVSQPN